MKKYFGTYKASWVRCFAAFVPEHGVSQRHRVGPRRRIGSRT